VPLQHHGLCLSMNITFELGRVKQLNRRRLSDALSWCCWTIYKSPIFDLLINGANFLRICGNWLYIYIYIYTTEWGALSTCCYYVLIILIYNYNLICIINMTFYFGLRDFCDTPYDVRNGSDSVLLQKYNHLPRVEI
jgi:hypothetical protein